MNDFVFRKEGFSSSREELLLNETLFHNANGYLGVRSNFEEEYDGQPSIRGEYVNAFYDITDMPQAELLYGFPTRKQTMVNTCDTQTIRLTIGNETFSLFKGTVLSFARELDMKAGTTRRLVRWQSPEGKVIGLSITRMASMTHPSLFTIEYVLTSENYSGPVCLESCHRGDVFNYSNPDDPRVGDSSERMMMTDRAFWQDGCSVITAHTSKSQLVLTSMAKDVLSVPCETVYDTASERLTAAHKLSISAGETVRLTRYTILCDSRRYASTEEDAAAEMAKVSAMPLEQLYQEQQAYLEKFWEQSSLEIDGDDQLQLSVRFSLYQLLQSAGRDGCSNIAAKGLSGEGYEGHYFWDTEMYELPFFALTNREQAKNLISYRYQILPKAREHAKIYGHKKGALFAWRTITGEECSGYYPSGSAQYHLNGDIAFAVVNYYLLTGDLDFMAEKGAEILFETARLWMDLGCWANGSFHLNCVTGPDEYTCCVNDNYYTNAGAKYNLYWAAKMWELLKNAGKLDVLAQRLALTEDEIESFRKAEAGMTLLYDEKTGINPQDDAFLQKPVWDFAGTPAENHPLLLHYHPLCLNRFQVCKQADTVLAHFVHEDYQSEETMRRSYDWYEKITTHDSSLSACIFGIMAARLGDMEKSVRYFSESSMLDITNAHYNTGDGIHTANMGGTYMGVVYGFAGLRVKEEGLIFRPQLPEGWKSYRFRFLYLDSLLELSVDANGAKLSLISGTPKTVKIWDETVTAQ